MSTTRAMTPAELRRLDDEYVARSWRRAEDRDVRRLRRELFPRVPTSEQRRNACLAARHHLHALGFWSELVDRVLAEEAGA